MLDDQIINCRHILGCLPKHLQTGTQLSVFTYHIGRSLAVLWNIHLSTHVADAADDFFIMFCNIFRNWIIPGLIILRPVRHHQRFLFRHQLAVYLLRDERHIRVQQLQSLLQYLPQSPQGVVGAFRILICVINTVLGNLNIPVAEFIPDEIIDLGQSNTKLEFIHILGHIFDQVVAFGHDPAVCWTHFKVCRLSQFFISQVHHNETGRIPYFVGKVPAGFHTFVVETHIISRRISGYQGHTQGVCPVLVNNLQGINSIPQRLAHLAA